MLSSGDDVQRHHRLPGAGGRLQDRFFLFEDSENDFVLPSAEPEFAPLGEARLGKGPRSRPPFRRLVCALSVKNGNLPDPLFCMPPVKNETQLLPFLCQLFEARQHPAASVAYRVHNF